MKLYTLDNIVRSALADNEYPIHWYINFLTHAIDVYRDLQLHTLQNVKSVRIPINSYQAGTLPCDYVDYIRVGAELGQYLDPYGEKIGSFNRLNNLDGSGNKIPWSDVEKTNGMVPNNWDGFWYTSYVNDKGEHLGRIFNNKPTFRNSFEILRERNEIQMDASYTGKYIVMDYITDGLNSDAASAVHPYAVSVIKAGIDYKRKYHARHYTRAEVKDAEDIFYNELRKTRAALTGLTITDIRRSLTKGYGPVIKN